MSLKKKVVKYERAKSSFGGLKRTINHFNDKITLSNNTNLDTSNTLFLSESNTLNKNKVYKIKTLSKSLFTKKREKPKIKKISLIQPKIQNKILNIKGSNDANVKKYLRAKLCRLMEKNIILNEKKFHPRKYTESIPNFRIKSFKKRFKNFNSEEKVGIFTNKYPSILNHTDKFYTRYFDYFISPDELLIKNFNKDEIFLIKTEPGYYNFGESFNNVYFFKKKKLRDILNEEEKIGINNIMEFDMQKSLQQSRKKIKSYLNYYTSVMSRRGFIHK